MGSRIEKQKRVAEIKKKLEKAKVVVLTDYRGLNVSEINELRNQLRELGTEYRVVKNTLTFLAVKELGLNELGQYLEEPTAVALGYEDEVSPAKVILKFSRGNKALSIKSGVLGGKVITSEQVKSLGMLPSRDILLGQVCGTFQAPLTAFANVLQGNIRALAYTLQAVREQKEKESA